MKIGTTLFVRYSENPIQWDSGHTLGGLERTGDDTSDRFEVYHQRDSQTRSTSPLSESVGIHPHRIYVLVEYNKSVTLNSEQTMMSY